MSIWKKFSFFSTELLQSADPGSPLYAIQSLDISCVTAGKGCIIFGDSEGGITMSDQEFALRRFQAYDFGVNHMYQYKSSNILLTIGDGCECRTKEQMKISRNISTRFRNNLRLNETYKWMLEDLKVNDSISEYFPMKNATLKLWLLDKIDDNGIPLCIRSFKLFEKIEEEIITCLSVDEDNQIIAFACESGSVYLIQGDLSRAKKLNLTLLPQQINIPITNLHLLPSSQSISPIHLFITTIDRIGCYTIPRESKKSVGFEILEEGSGCITNCSCIDKKGNLISARSEGLFYYSPTTRGNSYILPGEKSCVYSYQDSIVVSRVGEDNNWYVNVLNVNNCCEEYDLLVMRNGNSECITNIWSEWGLLFTQTEGHIVYLLREKETLSKLDLLYDRKLYQLAISLSHAWCLEDHELSNIHKKYGDWLYEQGDQESAMVEYLHTITFSDSSSIIQRYLDVSSIHLLQRYLEEIHRKKVAVPEHTILLMNCYTKLQDHKKLQSFLFDDSLLFQPQVAIIALSSSGFITESLQLAQYHSLHESYIHILLEYKASYHDAVIYLSSLHHTLIPSIIMKYGKKLIDKVPKQMTELLLLICKENQSIKPDQFIIYYVDQPKQLKKFLQSIIDDDDVVVHDSYIWNTLIELTLRPDLHDDPHHSINELILELLQRSNAKYEIEDVLVFLQHYHCEQGLVYLYQKLHMHAMLLQQYFIMGQSHLTIELCKSSVDDEEAMWELLLKMIGESNEVNETELNMILEEVQRSGHVPLIRIIQLIGDNENIPVEILKGLVYNQLQIEQSIRESDEKKLNAIQRINREKEVSIKVIQENGMIFQQTRCSACGLGLEVPIMHFYCGHSYHKACVNMEKNICMQCDEGKEEVDGMKYEVFMENLKQRKDGFVFVADCFGKGFFTEKGERDDDDDDDNDNDDDDNEKERTVVEEFDEESIPIQTLEM